MAALLPAAGGVGAGSHAAERDPSQAKEYEVKAAFLYNFLVFTTWPKEAFEKPTSPIKVLIVGKDPFGDLIDKAFKGKRIDQHPVEVARSKTLPEELDAHVIYFPASTPKKADELIAAVAKKPILLVGEQPGFAASGGTINFFIADSRIQFEINPDAAKQAKITLSSQLLKLAKIVKTKEKAE